MARTRLDTVIVVALLAAIAIWLGYADRALQPDSGIAAARDAPWVVGIVLAGCALDALAGARVARGRIGPAGRLWIGLRLLLSIVGFLFFTLPLYAIAAFGLTRAPAPDPRTDPTRPHTYRPASAGWFGALTPLWWSRNQLGATQLTAAQCGVCRGARDAVIHGPAA